MKATEIFKKVICWYGYIIKSTLSAINTIIWLNVGMFALTSFVGEMSLFSLTWNGFTMFGVLCYEFYKRRIFIKDE